MKAPRIFETCLYAKNLAACERFYRDVMGLETVVQWKGKGVAFRCGQGVLILFDPSTTDRKGGKLPPHGGSGAGHVAFPAAADELPRWRDHLARFGIPIEAEVQWAEGLSIYFRDPAGNLLELAPPTLWGFTA